MMQTLMECSYTCCFDFCTPSSQSTAEVQQRLLEHRKLFRKTLSYPNADYTTVSGVQVLILLALREAMIECIVCIHKTLNFVCV